MCVKAEYVQRRMEVGSRAYYECSEVCAASDGRLGATLLSPTEWFTSEAKASRVTVSSSLTLNVLLKTYTSTLVDIASTKVINSASSQPVRVGYIMLFSAYFKVNRDTYYQIKCTEVLEISHTQIFLKG